MPESCGLNLSDTALMNPPTVAGLKAAIAQLPLTYTRCNCCLGP